MPTNRRYRTKQRRQQIDELNQSLECELLHGRPLLPFLGLEFDDDDLMFRAWQLHREQLLPVWIDQRPGTRPFAWWKFEAVPKYGERRTTDYWRRNHEQHREQFLKHGILDTCTIPAMQEDEQEYLQRHGLLTDEEQRWLLLQKA